MSTIIVSSTVSRKFDEEDLKSQIDSLIEYSDEYEKLVAIELVDEKTVEAEMDTSSPKLIPEVNIEINFSIEQVTRKLSKDVIARINWLKGNPNRSIEEYPSYTISVGFDMIKLEVLNFVKKHPNSMTSDIIDKLNFDTWLILEALDQLKEEGLVE